MNILGVDVGGSGIKAAIVDTETGAMMSDRHRLDTPQSATPTEVAAIIAELVQHFAWRGHIGCGFPAAIVEGVAKTAANLDDSFIGVNINDLFTSATGCPVHCLNDADAAGMAEFTQGAGKNSTGTVVFITVGTGVGTAIYTAGHLLPNTELGHVYLPNGKEGERWASDATRKRKQLTWQEWAERFNDYLQNMEALFWPELFIIGGGASKKLDKFAHHLDVRTPLVAADLLNNAGIVGAAMYAAQMS